MPESDNIDSISSAKIEANRRNAKRSTGPRSLSGKNHSRINAIKHGILTSELLIKNGMNAERAREFNELLHALQGDLGPEGSLERVFVEKIAVCIWRLKRVLRCEAGMSEFNFHIAMVRDCDIDGEEADVGSEGAGKSLTLPLSKKLDQLLRYERSVHRQLEYAVSQLERLQRMRKGEHVPVPVAVQLAGDR